MTCDGKNFVGWPCDEKEEALRQQYIQETDPEKQKALVEAMHRRLWEVVPYVPLGQLKQPFLWRKNISGVLKANTLVFWNIEKNLTLVAEARDIDVAGRKRPGGGIGLRTVGLSRGRSRVGEVERAFAKTMVPFTGDRGGGNRGFDH
jgi:hypothetical protein